MAQYRSHGAGANRDTAMPTGKDKAKTVNVAPTTRRHKSGKWVTTASCWYKKRCVSQISPAMSGKNISGNKMLRDM
jgi:hypothetical protein